jgi:hypothetical protein
MSFPVCHTRPSRYESRLEVSRLEVSRLEAAPTMGFPVENKLNKFTLTSPEAQHRISRNPTAGRIAR